MLCYRSMLWKIHPEMGPPALLSSERGLHNRFRHGQQVARLDGPPAQTRRRALAERRKFLLPAAQTDPIPQQPCVRPHHPPQLRDPPLEVDVAVATPEISS